MLSDVNVYSIKNSLRNVIRGIINIITLKIDRRTKRKAFYLA